MTETLTHNEVLIRNISWKTFIIPKIGVAPRFRMKTPRQYPSLLNIMCYVEEKAPKIL